MNQYDVVKVIGICGDRFQSNSPEHQRHPIVGDVGTILEVYADAFEVECSDQATGFTLWLEAMQPEELQLVQATVLL